MKKLNKTLYDYIAFMQNLHISNKKENSEVRHLTIHSTIPLYEKETFAEYLSDMAKKGWLFTDFDKISSASFDYKRQRLVFIKSKTKSIKYCLDAFKAEGEPAGGEYLSACESSGWRFVTKTGNIYGRKYNPS